MLAAGSIRIMINLLYDYNNYYYTVNESCRVIVGDSY